MVSVRFRPEDLKAIDDVAKKQGVTRSDFIRENEAAISKILNQETTEEAKRRGLENLIDGLVEVA